MVADVQNVSNDGSGIRRANQSADTSGPLLVIVSNFGNILSSW